ncbi:MAG: YdeI/OmpD-associated family protein, partial [Bacteroidota bacterium]
DPDPDHVELGEELEEVLAMDEEAAARFYSFTPGKRRGLAHHVNSAKREATRIKRALEIAHKVRTYTLYDDLQRRAKDD